MAEETYILTVKEVCEEAKTFLSVVDEMEIAFETDFNYDRKLCAKILEMLEDESDDLELCFTKKETRFMFDEVEGALAKEKVKSGELVSQVLFGDFKRKVHEKTVEFYGENWKGASADTPYAVGRITGYLIKAEGKILDNTVLKFSDVVFDKERDSYNWTKVEKEIGAVLDSAILVAQQEIRRINRQKLKGCGNVQRPKRRPQP